MRAGFSGVLGGVAMGCFSFQDFRKQNKTAPEVNGVAMSQSDWTPGNSPWASGQGGVLPCTVHMSTAVWLEGCLVLGGGGSGGGATCLSPGRV